MSKNEYDEYTVQHYEELGFVVIPVESKTKFKTFDFLGFGDYLAIATDMTIAIQSTERGHHAERRAKILASWKAYMFLIGSEQSHEIHLISWRAGWDNGVYSRNEKIERIYLNDFPPETVEKAKMKIEEVRGKSQ